MSASTLYSQKRLNNVLNYNEKVAMPKKNKQKDDKDDEI